MDSEATPPGESTVTLPPPQQALAPSPTDLPPADDTACGSSLLGRLLKMADGYRAGNQIHQATEMYFQLVERHSQTPEAAQARERLIAIGDSHERCGELRQARSIFERLL